MTAVTMMMIRKNLSIFIALVFTGGLLIFPGHRPSSAEPALHGARVLEVNDGDTVTLRFNWRNYRTRLIGIDAPELDQAPWGRKAKDRLIELMNQTEWYVIVETDVEKRDKYGRLLAYLWTKRRELINERMILDGQAVLFTIPPNIKYVEKFTRAERRARQEKKGIWGPDGLKERPEDYRRQHPRMGHRF
ncbi:MAG TPA: thermonuclease family protein [Nitrospirota bacterium]